MGKRICIICAAVAFLLLCSSFSWAAEGWEINLNISSGTAQSRLSLGQRPDATNGDDGRYDVPAMLAGSLQAAFVDGGGTFWRDIRSTGTSQEWRLLIGAGTGQPVEISWASEKLPEGYLFDLVDQDGETYPMESYSKHTMEGSSSADLRIKVTRK